jgi:hypothetical protein
VAPTKGEHQHGQRCRPPMREENGEPQGEQVVRVDARASFAFHAIRRCPHAMSGAANPHRDAPLNDLVEVGQRSMLMTVDGCDLAPSVHRGVECAERCSRRVQGLHGQADSL